MKKFKGMEPAVLMDYLEALEDPRIDRVRPTAVRDRAVAGMRLFPAMSQVRACS
jgi:hypothetical protein